MPLIVNGILEDMPRPWLKVSIDPLRPGYCYAHRDKRGRVNRRRPSYGKWVVFDKAQEPSMFSDPPFKCVLFEAETFEECVEWIRKHEAA